MSVHCTDVRLACLYAIFISIQNFTWSAFHLNDAAATEISDSNLGQQIHHGQEIKATQYVYG
jgi:hypothetical protein